MPVDLWDGREPTQFGPSKMAFFTFQNFWNLKIWTSKSDLNSISLSRSSIFNTDRPNQPCSPTSQTTLMPPIDRSRRALQPCGTSTSESDLLCVNFQVCSRPSQFIFYTPIDRSRRDLSIGGIRLVWEVREGGLLGQSLEDFQTLILVKNWPFFDWNFQVCSRTSQTSLMPPIDRSRRDLSIGGIRLFWRSRNTPEKSIFQIRKFRREQ